MLEELTNKWWGICNRINPESNWCNTHQARMDTTKCERWLEYYGFARTVHDCVNPSKTND